MSRDYVHEKRVSGKTYFYLNPPRHLRLGLAGLRLQASTREEAGRQAAEFMASAMEGNSVNANLDLCVIEEKHAPEFCEHKGCRSRPDFVVGANADFYLCRACVNHPAYQRFRLPPSPLPHFIIERHAIEKQARIDQLARRREVPLHGKYCDRVAWVDEADLELVSQYRWYGLDPKTANEWGGLIYARTDFRLPDGSVRYHLMHRLILNQPTDIGTDHLDGNGLNNQRHNLRPATPTQNGQNQQSHRAIKRQLAAREHEAIERTSDLLHKAETP